jgi:hypothetical protein
MGMLANAHYLQIDSLMDVCYQAIRHSVEANEHDAIVSQPTFGPGTVPGEVLRVILEANAFTKTARVKVRHAIKIQKHAHVAHPILCRWPWAGPRASWLSPTTERRS